MVHAEGGGGGGELRGRRAEGSGGERRRRRATEGGTSGAERRRRGGRARGKAARRGRAARRVSHESGGMGGESGAVGRHKYRESCMDGCTEGESCAEGGVVSPPASARPAENLGDREGGREKE